MPACAWGSKSFVEEDIVTGRGEVWVARPLDSSNPAASKDWGMRTVAMNPHSPTACVGPKGSVHKAVKSASDPHNLETGHMPQRPPRVQGGPADFSNWEGGNASAIGRSAAGCGPGASIIDLTRSVTDDWIVVDSDDEDSVAQRRAAGVIAGSGGGESDVWQERVKKAKGAALQVKMGITSFFQSLAK